MAPNSINKIKFKFIRIEGVIIQRLIRESGDYSINFLKIKFLN